MRQALSLLLVLVAARAFATEGRISVPGDVTVEGSQITLAEIGSFEGVAPTLGERLGEISFGFAAPPGRSRVLERATIRGRIARVDPTLTVVLPAQVRVRTAYRKVSSAEVRDRVERAIRIRMPWPPEAVRFSRWAVPEAFPAPARGHRVLVRFRPDEDFLGRVGIQIEVSDPAGGDRSRVVRTVSVEVDVRLPVVIAAEQIRRGKTLDPSSLRMEERELRELPRGVLRGLADAVGRRAARSVAEGAPLFNSSIQRERLVRRGDPIAVEAESPGLALKVEARALENGALGQVIRVENLTSRRRFLVEVTGERRGRVAIRAVGAGP